VWRWEPRSARFVESSVSCEVCRIRLIVTFLGFRLVARCVAGDPTSARCSITFEVRRIRLVGSFLWE